MGSGRDTEEKTHGIGHTGSGKLAEWDTKGGTHKEWNRESDTHTE